MEKNFNTVIRRIEYNKVTIKNFILYFPILALIILLSLKIGWKSYYINIIQEDAIIESLEFITYLSASIIAIVTSFRYMKNGLPIITLLLFFFGMCLFFVSGEEISWGQRLFNIKPDQWFIDNNVQEETTIHNLNLFHNKLLFYFAFTGFIFSFGWIPNKHFSSFRKIKGNLKAVIQLFSPRQYLILYFLPTFILYSYWLQEFFLKSHLKWFRWNSTWINNFVIVRDQEPIELLLAIGFLLYVISIVWSLKSSFKKGVIENNDISNESID